MAESKFLLGDIVITANAKDSLHPDDIELALRRHAVGDWGELDEHDLQANEVALAQGLRLLSAYTARAHVRF